MGLPSHNGRQCEADALAVSGEVPGKARDSSVVTKPVLVEGEDRACTKASHMNCRNVVKNKLGCSKFSTKTKALV